MPTSLAKKISLFPLFSNFKKPELAEIAQNCFIKTLFKDEQLFVLGEKRDVFFIVVEGEIGIIRKLGEASQMVEIVNPGEYIAEHALFNPKELHSHTAIAISKEAVVIGLPGKLFPKLSQKTANKLLLNLLPIISDNFSHASNRMMTILQIGQIVGAKITSLETLGTSVLETLLQAIQAQKALIALREHAPHQAKIRAIAGFESTTSILNKMIDLRQDFILETTIERGQTINISETEYLLSKKKVPYVNASVLGIPLTIAGKTIGALLLIDKKDQHSFNTNNEVLLNIIAETITLGIRHAEQTEFQEADRELRREYIEGV
ncbi:MAG: hypothetical protein A2445_01150 [Candidatus Jacksonbacteria bacterium RIFOXYC2_FULL_44_29]|nr:MAG: hypothetical protein A2240_00520 [Candidatus Jacksonbacteria bacterium RIFOXYA2_FULL_43_12]OGY77174.1 MAG: hypothetical protein A2295_04860 [Candidatus Jacksonbacteria bacterium RIFOXYB2_FULL_44_15]OGY78097.1 MAG: hypothetical protein A2550_03490 [Candidatus Jacksonbacteria bacterium RIFOXYD2_FULL_43_21]OGY79864.1 MAG: hypothetical protein A2445_01150 [Candidatus Jacksonbacteria bacterium RIFOXYC2_FULL_44_29]HBH46983.1 hypothetical protein [Candidatus Jacksonbacteria bacterium]